MLKPRISTIRVGDKVKTRGVSPGKHRQWWVGVVTSVRNKGVTILVKYTNAAYPRNKITEFDFNSYKIIPMT